MCIVAPKAMGLVVLVPKTQIPPKSIDFQVMASSVSGAGQKVLILVAHITQLNRVNTSKVIINLAIQNNPLFESFFNSHTEHKQSLEPSSKSNALCSLKAGCTA